MPMLFLHLLGHRTLLELLNPLCSILRHGRHREVTSISEATVELKQLIEHSHRHALAHLRRPYQLAG